MVRGLGQINTFELETHFTTSLVLSSSSIVGSLFVLYIIFLKGKRKTTLLND